MLRLRGTLAVTALLLSCKPAPKGSARVAPEPLPVEWSTVSKTGNATVTARRQGATCQVVCERAGSIVWERTDCLAKSVDHRFVSDDCATFVALHDAPFVDPVLSRTRVGAVNGASGELVPLRLGRLATTSTAKLSDSGRWVAWLAGTVGHAGAPPRDLPDGSGLAFETLDGATHSLSFVELSRWVDELDEPHEPDAGVAAPLDEHPGVYQWVDGDGVTQITTWAQVPPKKRATAVVLSAEISVIKSGAPKPALGPPEPMPDPATKPDRCAEAQREVDRLEAALGAIRPEAMENCARFLACQNRGCGDRYAQCVYRNAGKEERAAEGREKAALNQKLEAARDTLRRIQISGCR